MHIDKNRNREILKIKLEDGCPCSVDWSPDGTRIVVGNSSGGVEVWTAAGQRLWRCIENKIYVSGICWAPNGLQIASALDERDTGSTMRDKTIRIYDAASGKVLFYGKAGIGNWKIAWSQDSSRLAWSVEKGNSYIIRIFHATTGLPLMDCSGHTRVGRCVSWSPIGNVLASGSTDKTIRLWDTATGFCLFCLEGHNRAINDLCWSPDGSLIASASNDETVRVWSTKTGDCLFQCEGHESYVGAVSWSSGGSIIASGSWDHSIRLWAADSGVPLLQLNGHTKEVDSVVFSPDGTRLASGSGDGTIRLWDVSDLIYEKKSSILNFPLGAYISRQAATIGIRPPPAKVKAPPWVPHLLEEKGECLGVLRYPNIKDVYPSVAMFPDGRSIATSHSDGTIRRWDLRTGAILWQGTEKHSDIMRKIAVSPKGFSVATASDDRSVRTWDAQTGQCLKQFKGHKKRVWQVRWCSDGKRLASIEWSNEKQLRIWDAETGECLWIGEGHTELTQGLDWSTDGQFIATGDDGGNIIIWDADSKQNLRQFSCHKGFIFNLRWSPDNRSLLAGFRGGTALVVNPFDGSIRFRLKGHTDGISALDWSKDGRFIATGARDKDKTLRVWDAKTGQEVKSFTFDEEACHRLAFSPDSAFIVASLYYEKYDKIEDVFRIYDTRNLPKNKTAKTVTMVEPSLDKPLPEHLKHLPPALAQMLRLNIYPPLSLVRDMLDLLANRCTVESLQTLLNQNSGIQALQDLHWSFAARIGLAALLLHNYLPSEWKPPSDATPSQIRDALMTALTGEPIEPQPPAPPISLLTQAAEIIDDRLLSLLSMLGPEAVAADPGLPLRLLSRIKEIPPLSISQRRQMGIRISTPGISGQSTGLAPGADRGQIGDIQMGPLRSDFTSLLPTQLALPPLVKMYRHLRNELLFRAREMAEPPRLRPAVILLDVSPSTFGPIEKITRLAAFTVAQSLRRAGLPAILLTNSDGIKEGQWLLELNHPADMVEIWLQRTLKYITASRSLELARVLRAGMQEKDGLEPIILVLSHPWYGADEEIPPIKNIRGLFVQFPNYPTVPALSNQCEKWKTVEATQVNDLTSILAQLIT